MIPSFVACSWLVFMASVGAPVAGEELAPPTKESDAKGDAGDGEPGGTTGEPAGSDAHDGDEIDSGGSEGEPTPEEGGDTEPEVSIDEPAPAAETVPASAAAAVEVPRGPPFYRPEEIVALRNRYGVPADPQDRPSRPVWRCLIPDPRCGLTVELLATSAYTYRMRQGEVDVEGDSFRWHSGRAAYDVWLDIPAYAEVRGKWKYTRLTLGPKGGLIASDGENLWGNVGMGMRYWFGRGAWAPALEFSTALTFRLRGTRGDGDPGPVRSPVGITADIGLNVGGWGAIIFGAQYDSPLAREDVPERFRQAAAGQIFVGFRGNVLWGVPAGAAVATHAATQRSVTAP